MVVLRCTALNLSGLQALAERLARVLHPGDLVLLMGPLGSGKTEFVRCLAQPLGLLDAVRSPSFTIANVYRGRVTVNHLDLYRLEHIADEDTLALEEYLSPDAVTLVEWPEAGGDRLPAPQWVIRFEHDTLSTRNVEVEAGSRVEAARFERAG